MFTALRTQQYVRLNDNLYADYFVLDHGSSARGVPMPAIIVITGRREFDKRQSSCRRKQEQTASCDRVYLSAASCRLRASASCRSRLTDIRFSVQKKRAFSTVQHRASANTETDVADLSKHRDNGVVSRERTMCVGTEREREGPYPTGGGGLLVDGGECDEQRARHVDDASRRIEHDATHVLSARSEIDVMCERFVETACCS